MIIEKPISLLGRFCAMDPPDEEIQKTEEDPVESNERALDMVNALLGEDEEEYCNSCE